MNNNPPPLPLLMAFIASAITGLIGSLLIRSILAGIWINSVLFSITLALIIATFGFFLREELRRYRGPGRSHIVYLFTLVAGFAVAFAAIRFFFQATP